MTGDNLSRNIRSVRLDIPILICTGFSHLLNEEKVISLGINELLMKPIECGALAEAVRNALDGI